MMIKKKIIEKCQVRWPIILNALDKWQILVEFMRSLLEGLMCRKKNYSADNEKKEDKEGHNRIFVCLLRAHYLMSLKNYKTGPRRLSYKCLFSLLLCPFNSLFESLLKPKNQNNFFFVNQNALMINGWTLIMCRLWKKNNFYIPFMFHDFNVTHSLGLFDK